MEHILGAAAIFENVVDKHQPHRTAPFLIQLRSPSVPANARHKNAFRLSAGEYRTRSEHIPGVDAARRGSARKPPPRREGPDWSLARHRSSRQIRHPGRTTE